MKLFEFLKMPSSKNKNKEEKKKEHQEVVDQEPSSEVSTEVVQEQEIK